MYNLDTLKSEYPQHQEVIMFYKTTPCPTIQQENDSFSLMSRRTCFQVPCYHYHSHQDIRRPVIDQENNCLAYEPVFCPSLQGGFQCAEGVECRYCHTQNELNYHPLYYKTEPCVGCMNQANPKFCPKYHPDEANRSTLVMKIMADSCDENSLEDSRTKHNQFILDTFKVKPCAKKGNHNVKICDYYHHDKDRRRPTSIFSYTPPMCSFILRNAICPHGDNCRYAHNKLEQLYHPERYKRKFCLHHPHNIHKCEYGDHCSFAHHEDEILIELLHNMKQDEYFYLTKYKTVFCPYIYEHDRTQCIYAHNPQDFRRDPEKYRYTAIQCMYWSQGQIYSYEEGGCQSQMECQNCHGWKELEYHPLSYKTKPCNNAKKCTKKDCPFYHSNADRRQIKTTSQLTKSLLMSQSNGFKAPTNSGMFKPGSPQPVEQGMPKGIGLENKMNMSYQQANGFSFTPYKTSEGENSRKIDVKSGRPSGSSQATTTYASPVNIQEDDSTLNMFYKPTSQFAEFQFGFQSSVKTNSAPEKSQFDLMRNLSPQPFDLWGSFQPSPQDKLEDFFPNDANSLKSAKPAIQNKIDDSFDSIGGHDQKKSDEDSCEMSNEEFKKALISNLENKGLGRVKQYLINPLIDIKALKSFSKKDFPLFPQISTEDKEKIVKIIQDILEVEALLSDANTLNDNECHVSRFSEDDNLFKCIGSWERSQDFVLKGMDHDMMNEFASLKIN